MRKELIENNPLLKLSIAFSLQVIDYCELLNSEKKFILSKQLLRSATSIGANAMEAQNPESKADFIHKIKIAAKEADETEYWLMLCKEAIYDLEKTEIEGLLIEINVIQKIITKIVASSKTRSKIDKQTN